MTCTRIDLPSGGFAIACTRNVRPKKGPPCHACKATSTVLCDHKLNDDGKTCDKPCCAAHSLRIARNFDLCQACATIAGRWPTATATPTPTSSMPLGPATVREAPPAPPMPPPAMLRAPRTTQALHVVLLGSLGHGALADVHRQVAAYAPGTTLFIGDRRGVEEEAAIVARARGLGVVVCAQRPGEAPAEHAARIVGEAVHEAGARPIEVELFPWAGEGGPSVLSYLAARRAAEALGIPAFVHEPGTPQLLVWTARLGASKDPDELDITRGTAGRYAPDEQHRALADFDRHRAAKAHAEGFAGARLFRCDKALRECGWGTLGAPWAPSAVLLSEGKGGLDFATYATRYKAEMRVSIGMPRARHGELEKLAVARGVQAAPLAWRWLREQARVVAACFCTDGPEHCHRGTFAEIMTALGAHYAGELTHG